MTDAPLLIHDTLSGEKRPLEPLEPGKVGIYCCGPTTYDMAHIGHARAALLPDLLVRVLRRRGLEVKYVRNVTDVDDKIIKRAVERGEEPTALSDRYAREYRRDMGDLRMLAPDVEPKVSEHIEQIVALIQGLVDKGLAYPVDGGDVYYRVDRFDGYGKLSGRKLEDMQAGARIEVDARKEHPMDFALWKGAKPGEPSWDSPWGAGRPGWHIECSAMSEAHLGQTFDIHTGGRDLIFPHHENEIAQSQGCHGHQTYARTWVHNGFVNFAGEKMSKSLGNFFTVREVTALYHPEVLRFFLLGVHYRSGVNFDVEVTCPSCEAVLSQEEQQAHRCSACSAELDDAVLRRRVRFVGLEEADERVAYVYETLRGAREFLDRAKAQPHEGEVVESVGTMLARFDAAMADDLNTAAATAELSEALSEINRLLQTGKGVDKKLRYRTIARFVADMEGVASVLGLFEREPAEWLMERRDLKARRIGLDVARVESLVAARDEARKAKDFEAADRVRAELDELGVEIRDGAAGSTWSL